MSLEDGILSQLRQSGGQVGRRGGGRRKKCEGVRRAQVARGTAGGGETLRILYQADSPHQNPGLLVSRVYPLLCEKLAPGHPGGFLLTHQCLRDSLNGKVCDFVSQLS